MYEKVMYKVLKNGIELYSGSNFECIGYVAYYGHIQVSKAIQKGFKIVKI